MQKLLILIFQSLILYLSFSNIPLYAHNDSQEQRTAEEIQLINLNSKPSRSVIPDKTTENTIMASHPVYPPACDPFPIPTNPEGPVVIENFTWFEDAFTLKAWRYPCDEENSWVIFTVLPEPGSTPYICSTSLILVQEGFQSALFMLTQDPAGENQPQCSDVVVASSYALVDRYSPSPVIDLEKAFDVYWDLGDNDQNFPMFKYNPEDYDIENPPPAELSNDIGINGLFYDPDNPGHGFDFNKHETGLTIWQAPSFLHS